MAGASNPTLARSGLMQVADANRFVIVMLVPPPAGGDHTQAGITRQVDQWQRGGEVNRWRKLRRKRFEPSGVPYVMAAVNSVRMPIEPRYEQVHDIGGSSGANMARELICDSRTASTFRGVATLGGGANAKCRLERPAQARVPPP